MILNLTAIFLPKGNSEKCSAQVDHAFVLFKRYNIQLVKVKQEPHLHLLMLSPGFFNIFKKFIKNYYSGIPSTHLNFFPDFACVPPFHTYGPSS